MSHRICHNSTALMTYLHLHFRRFYAIKVSALFKFDEIYATVSLIDLLFKWLILIFIICVTVLKQLEIIEKMY